MVLNVNTAEEDSTQHGTSDPAQDTGSASNSTTTESYDPGPDLAGGDIENFDDVPDALLDDSLGATGEVMGGFEKGAMKSGDYDGMKDAMTLKTAALQQQQSSELADLSDFTDQIKPDPARAADSSDSGKTPGLDKRLGTRDVRNMIDECLPCLDRPEIIGGIDNGLKLSVRLFSDLLKRFTVLDKLISLTMPLTPYDITCGVLNALSSQCIPDLTKIILLLKFQIAISIRKIIASFDFSSAKLSELILLPMVIGLQAILCTVYDTILLPFECIVSSFYRQASKIPGAIDFVRSDNDEKGWDPDFGIDTFVEKLRESKDSMYEQLAAFQHDFDAALCQTGFQCNFVIDILNNIKVLLGYIKMIEQLIDIQSAKRICGIGEYRYDASDYYGAISQVTGEDNTRLNNDGNLIVFDDPPVDITPDDIEVLKEVSDAADNLWEDREVQPDPDMRFVYTSLKDQVDGVNNLVATFSSGSARRSAGLDGSGSGSGSGSGISDSGNVSRETLVALGDATDISGLDGKMIVSIFNLRKCFERIRNNG